MKALQKAPCGIAQLLLRKFLPERESNDLLGDYAEYYREVSDSRGRAIADLWYGWQIVTAVRMLFCASLRQGYTMFVKNLLYVWRHMKKNRMHAFISVSGLTVGMACFILIALWIYDETHYDSFHANSGRIFRLILHKAAEPGDPGFPSTPYILPRILKEAFPEIEETVLVRDKAYPSAVRYGQKSFYEDRFYFSESSFFSMFSYAFLQGDPASALNGARSVVITRSSAAKYFGTDDPLGKVLHWNETEDLVVTGVIEDVPYDSHLQFDMIASIEFTARNWMTTWRREAAAYVLLREGASRDEVESRISGIILEHHPEDDFRVSLQSLQDAHLTFSHGGSNDKRVVLIFAVLAVAILLIACINYTNISTARSSIRAPEVGVWKAVGARRSDLIRQFLGEAVVLAFLALLFAAFIVEVVLNLYNRNLGTDIALLSGGSIPVLVFLAAVALMTGITAGGYPALVLSSFKPIRTFKHKGRKAGRSAVLRTVLVTSQFATAIIMIILTVFARRQFNYIQKADLGFERTQIIRFQSNGILKKKYELFKERLLQHPGILNVTAASALPHLLFNFNGLEWDGMESEHPVEVNCLYVDPDYVETFDLEIVQGRDFSKTFATDVNEAFIVNASALSMLGYEDPLGKRLSLGGREGKIIGVVKDFNFAPLIFKIDPLVMAVRPDQFHDFLVKVSPDEMPRTLAYMEDVFAEVAPGFPFEYRFIDDFFNMVYRPLQFINLILDAFTGIALFISCLGLFGLASLLTEQRKKEMGIRKVLGASTAGIFTLLSRRFILTILAANVIAAPLGYFITRLFLGFFVYRIGFDPFVIVASSLITILVSLMTVGYQVLKTARVNPSECLRYE